MPNAIGVSEQVSLVMSLRKKGIRDLAVLRAMELVPRDFFCAPGLQGAGLLRYSPANRMRADHLATLCGSLYERRAAGAKN